MFSSFLKIDHSNRWSIPAVVVGPWVDGGSPRRLITRTLLMACYRTRRMERHLHALHRLGVRVPEPADT